jgi:S-adenosylmethionine:tRNA ribosyltransferase-isomerase
MPLARGTLHYFILHPYSSVSRGVVSHQMNELADYDFELPRELIAQHPLTVRSDARLLLVDRSCEKITHAYVRDLPDLLQPTDNLVLNDSRVLPARLVGHRLSTGGRWQGLYLRSDSSGVWEVIGKTRGKLRAGEVVELCDRTGEPVYELTMITALGEGRWAARPDAREPVLDILRRVGRVPLPPYIRGGEMNDADRDRYQTVYARHAGSVAAPTAGLHFTHELLARLGQTGISLHWITLHVGPGTFRPISTVSLDDHQMHSEWGEIASATAASLSAARARQERVIAVGTTAARLLETAASDGHLVGWTGETQLFIRPPFEFHAIDGLLTNFHLPRSTLLVLVMTFGGHALIRRAYREAVRHRYRFYSYGDAMLIV